MLKSWKKRPMSLIVIVIGYVISILVVSMLISSIETQAFQYSQSKFGKEKNRTAILLYSKASLNYKSNTIDLLKFLGKTAEVDVFNLSSESIKSGSNTFDGDILPFYYENKPDWRPKLYEGRYITTEECIKDTRQVVIGVNLAEKLNAKVGNKISFYGEEYSICGIVGAKNIETNFDNVVYVPVGALPKEYLQMLDSKIVNRSGDSSQLNINILYRLSEEKINKKFQELNQQFKCEFLYDKRSNIQNSITIKDIFTEVIWVSLPLLIVALINIISISTFWILDRKKELSIKKVLGANDKYIKNSIEKDMLFVAVTSSIIAMILQVVLSYYVEPIIKNYGVSFNFTFTNFIISMALALTLGYLASMIPVEKTLEMNPADALKAR
ncbi:ABC transporter permease [Inconstantimicrobium mannanitabidum]|uniref:Uncharacterized protein n=1 Tax=Inconstantimicrobium mannanitabidum TaxID=1604901 RepID=A0ACB5RE40_9CLOT|nr:ABC transporter permease [Clostridium sp. TW13]GKX67024.1 hypothetical protein rsdtw13_22820 [Clostridium sp. TW13]